MKLIRQRTAIAYSCERGERLWQQGYFERVLRPTDDVAQIISYIRANPAAAGLPGERSEFPYVWWTPDFDTHGAAL
jgi:hypothetical protein